MTTSNSAAPRSVWSGFGTAALLALLQRIPANLVHWILVLGRPPRARPPGWSMGAVVAAFAIVVVVVASMFFVDTTAIDWARHLPHWVNQTAENHQSRPLRRVSLSARFHPPRSRGDHHADPVAHGPGCAGVSRRPLRLLVRGDRPAQPVRDHHQAPDRPGAPLCRGPRRSIRVSAVRVEARIRQHAIGTRDNRGGGGHRDRRDLAAAASGDVALRADHHAQPHPHLRPPSQRRDRRRAGGRRRRAIGAPLVCGAQSRIFSAVDLRAYPWPSWRRFKATAREVFGASASAAD